jgi:hypothetical protein
MEGQLLSEEQVLSHQSSWERKLTAGKRNMSAHNRRIAEAIRRRNHDRFRSIMEESYPGELPRSEPHQNAHQRLTCQQFADADGIFAYHRLLRSQKSLLMIAKRDKIRRIMAIFL